MLWNAQPVEGQTLNAVVFGSIIESFGLPAGFNQVSLSLVLFFEAGLLFVAANTGFLGGPSVLSNMADDSWLPHQFRHLSTRLVTQNGIVIMGLAALVILLWSRGKVDLLVANAGIGMRTVNPRFMTDPQPFWQVSPDGFRDVVTTKLTGSFLVAREVAPLELDRG